MLRENGEVSGFRAQVARGLRLSVLTFPWFLSARWTLFYEKSASSHILSSSPLPVDKNPLKKEIPTLKLSLLIKQI